MKTRVCLLTKWSYVRISPSNTLLLAADIETIKKFVKHVTKSSGFSCVSTTLQLQSFSNTLAQNLDGLQA